MFDDEKDELAGDDGEEEEGASSAEEGASAEPVASADPFADLDDETIAKLSSDPRIVQAALNSDEGKGTLDQLFNTLLGEHEEKKAEEQRVEQQAKDFEGMIAEAEERGLTPLEAAVVNRWKEERALAPKVEELRRNLTEEQERTLNAALDDMLEATGLAEYAGSLTESEAKALARERFPNKEAQVKAVLQVLDAKRQQTSSSGAVATTQRRSQTAAEAAKGPPVLPDGTVGEENETDLRSYLSEKLNK